MVCIVKSFPVGKSADVSRDDFGRCCTDSTEDGETNLNSTQILSCKVNRSSLYTSYTRVYTGYTEQSLQSSYVRMLEYLISM